MNDPFLDNTHTYLRLLKEYEKHKSLVIACDFDNSLFDYHSKGYKFPKLIKLMQDCKKIGFKIVIFSGSAKERYPFIREYCEGLGIEIDGINEDLIDWHPDKTADWSNSKIYFNILLDDRAGLASAYEVLKMLVDNIKSKTGLDDWDDLI
jgi:hypothetical protein